MRARLVANQLLQFEHEEDFQDFMIRFHCLPYATDFKFEVNSYINDYYALQAERAAAEKLSYGNMHHRKGDYSEKLSTIEEDNEYV